MNVNNNNFNYNLMNSFEQHHKFDVSYHFKTNLEQVWNTIKDMIIMSKINSDVQSHTEIIRGTDSWTVGSQYMCIWYGVSKVLATCVECESLSFYKKISWRIDLEIGFKYLQTIYFYYISQDNTTLVVWETNYNGFEVPSMEKETLQEYRQMSYELLKKVDMYISRQPVVINQFESAIINTNIQLVWDLMTNWVKLRNVCPSIGDDVSYEGSPVEIGGKVTISCKKGFIIMEVKKVEFGKNLNKWEYVLTSLAAKTLAPFQDVHVNINKISDNISQLSFYHMFKDPIKYEILMGFSEMKKSLLKSIKAYLENIV